MKNKKTNRTEFYETAVAMGFYGNADSGLFGKKDNVRKYWEDMILKTLCRPFVEGFLKDNTRLSILDLGCGSGEGFELLTHIPPSNPREEVNKNFVLLPIKIREYLGLDVSPGMITQGRVNYQGRNNVRFEYANMEEGLPPLALNHEPFDLYFSSYGALSHLDPDSLEKILKQVFTHGNSGSVFAFDVHGKYSPEWPVYWNDEKSMLPYTMAYLYEAAAKAKSRIEWFNVCYWTPEKLIALVNDAAENAKVKIKILYLQDRSIFVGRHMDTGIFSKKKLQVRYQINRLIDHGYRGEPKHLKIDLGHLENYNAVYPPHWLRLTDYKNKWNKVIYFLEALLNHQDKKISGFIEDESVEILEEEFRFLAWLFRNSDRFPVADFWASVIGPQVAMILRNIEMSYQTAEGCGHGLMCAVEITK